MATLQSCRFFPFVRSVLLVSVSASLLDAQTILPLAEPPLEQFANKQVVGHVFNLKKMPPPEAARLRVPKDFRIERFAENLGNARILAVGPNGNVYVTRRDEADVLMFKVGANGLAEGAPIRVASRAGIHGITFHAGKVYLATPHEIFLGDVKADGTFTGLDMIIHDLPDAGQHHTRMVLVGPDNMLYISAASTTNEANEPNPEAATVLRASLDGKSRSIFASGLRDVVGYGWQPRTGELWAMDHGIDWLGDDEQPEELNLLEKGKRYGWPYFYADNQDNVNRQPPGGLPKSEVKKVSTPMVMGYTAHSSPMQLAFYTGTQFPAEYAGDAFVSMRGSWNRNPASGYEIVRIRFDEKGRAKKIEPFLTGFVSDDEEYGRVCGNAIAADGSLLFTDDRNGIIYRVSYTGSAKRAQPPGPTPAEPMRLQNRDGVREPLASELKAGQAEKTIVLTSPAVANGQPIPGIYSSYDQNASVPLEWTAGPDGTKSYALLMEDPDASILPLPVVHWVAWNIPAEARSLREGLPPAERLRDPMGLRQGANYSGVSGYSGPKPPEGEKAHRYFFQLFALDKTLELPVGATRQELLAAIDGHVLATGVFHGTFARPDKPKKP